MMKLKKVRKKFLEKYTSLINVNDKKITVALKQ